MNTESFTFNRNWVETVKLSLPEHAGDIEKNLILAMTNHSLDEIDAHGCALASALAYGNGGLAFEIAMSNPLAGTDAREAAIKASIVENINGPYSAFVSAAEFIDMDLPTTGMKFDAVENHGGVSQRQFLMYSLASAIIRQDASNIQFNMKMLRSLGVTAKMMQDVATIASVVFALGMLVM